MEKTINHLGSGNKYFASLCKTFKKIEDIIGTYRYIFILGFILGLISYVVIYGRLGIALLDIFNTDLRVFPLSTDVSFTEIASEHFLTSPWSFPLGSIDGLVYPETTSIIFTDAIPIAALIAKLFYPLVGKPFQYAGLYAFICYGLQGGFAALLLRKYTDGKLKILLASLFYIFSLPMIARVIGHTSMAGHFIILAALCMWWYQDYTSVRKYEILFWTLILAVSSLISLYITGMIGAVMIGYFLSLFIKRRPKTLMRMTLVFAISLLSTVCVFWLAGGFVSGTQGGFDNFSFVDVGTLNLNGFYNPFLSRHFNDLPGRIFQYGNSSWLGLGIYLVLVLVLCSYLVWRKAFSREVLVRVTPFIIIGVGLTLIAISPAVTWNEKVLFEVPLPTLLLRFLSIFRSSCRMFWPVYYMIFTFALGHLISHTKLKNYMITILLVVTVSVQLWDIDFEVIRNKITPTYNQNLTSEFWGDTAAKYQYIDILPLGGRHTLVEVGQLAYIALQNDFPMNSYQMARMPEAMIPYAYEAIEQIRDGTFPKGHLVVLNELSPLVSANLAGKEVCFLDGICLLLDEGAMDLSQYPEACVPIVSERNLTSYLTNLQHLPSERIVLLSAKDDVTAMFFGNVGAKQAFLSLGLDINLGSLEAHTNFAAVLSSSQNTPIFSAAGADPILFEQNIYGNAYEIASGGGNTPYFITLNGTEISFAARGLNICIVNTRSGVLEQMALFDPYNGIDSCQGIVLDFDY